MSKKLVLCFIGLHLVELLLLSSIYSQLDDLKKETTTSINNTHKSILDLSTNLNFNRIKKEENDELPQ